MTEHLADRNIDELKDLARDLDIGDYNNMTHEQLVAVLQEHGVPDDSHPPVYGPQDAIPYPKVPITKADFRELLDNPDLPAENQSAPEQETLNPHIFPNRLP